MRYLTSVLLLSLIFTRSVLHAQTSDPYADALVYASNQVYQPSLAVGAPDGSFLTFFSKDATLTLDMGEGEEGTGDLFLYVELLNFGARYVVDFLDAQQNVLIWHGDIFPIMTPKITVPYSASTPYRYVRIRSDASSAQWKLDAVEAAHYASATPPAPEPEPEPEPQPAPSIVQGDVIKLADDGNHATTHDAAVYAVGADGKRHAFPNETAYFSWYASYAGIKIVSAETMASYPLGANVTMRPGTHLVKITTDPKTYAIESGGLLRWITSEQIAQNLYGTNWMSKVVDVPDVFFKNYTMGDDVTLLNAGVLITTPTGTSPF
ncbi:MAG: hypothetical protein UY77_C0030G0001 [Candidatus Uhrbacteria bacterium GW2011_GWA2_53_10]|uniref:Uncharacterized protein n=1 Tax=Candidatus Uhrbacteria bacterium GW2011_GWA2_53_10 TaxID=1618980 RepID=A0A0G1XMT9_9BACT|nr:MAG: hypothetical protein UY77_C0030G0001 [Candidatus Uhrbacteria bacterium GW2011_GWA2_53_10]